MGRNVSSRASGNTAAPRHVMFSPLFLLEVRLSHTLTRATCSSTSSPARTSSARCIQRGLDVMDRASLTKRASPTSTAATRRGTRNAQVCERRAGHGRTAGGMRGSVSDASTHVDAEGGEAGASTYPDVRTGLKVDHQARRGRPRRRGRRHRADQSPRASNSDEAPPVGKSQENKLNSGFFTQAHSLYFLQMEFLANVIRDIARHKHNRWASCAATAEVTAERTSLRAMAKIR